MKSQDRKIVHDLMIIGKIYYKLHLQLHIYYYKDVLTERA